MTRAVRRTTWNREPRVVEGRRREILVGVAHDGDSRLGGESEQSAIRRDVGDSGSGNSRRTQSRHSADLDVTSSRSLAEPGEGLRTVAGRRWRVIVGRAWGELTLSSGWGGNAGKSSGVEVVQDGEHAA